MKKLKQIILVLFSLAILPEAFAQEIITTIGKHYHYGVEGRIYNSEIKDLENTIVDSTATRSSRFQQFATPAWALDT